MSENIKKEIEFFIKTPQFNLIDGIYDEGEIVNKNELIFEGKL